MKKTSVNIPEKSLWYLFICGGIILLIILVGIFPLYKVKANSADKIKRLENQLVAQKELGPIYLILTKTMENKKKRVLPNPEIKTISREKAENFPDMFKEITEKSGLRMVSITPDLSSLTGNTSFLVQNAIVRGDFAGFRKLLIELGEVSYVKKIEEVSMRQLPGSMELKAKIWLAVSGD